MGLFNFKKDEQKKKGNEYTELFSKDANKSINDEKSDVLDSVVSTADDKGPKSVLGLNNEAPIDTSSFIDQDYHLRKKLSFVRGLFFFLLFSSVSLLGYFFIELNSSVDILTPYLGQNTTQSLEDLEEKLLSTQTKVNEYRHLNTKMYLDDFSYDADKFLESFTIYNSNADSVTRTQAEAELIDLQNKLAKNFERAKKKLVAKIWVSVNEKDIPEDKKIEFETSERVRFTGLLKDHFSAKIDVVNGSSEKAAAAKIDEMEELNQAMKLIGNTELVNALKTSDFSNLAYKDVKALIDKVNGSTSNALSQIYKIKKDRVKWSKILQEIDLAARKTEPSYNNGFFEELGGVQFNSYQFDSNSGRIIVTGQVKTDDGSNFSLMATLVDNFGKSKLFKTVVMRSFSKSKGSNDDFLSNLKLDFALQQENELDPQDAGELIDENIETLSFAEERVTVKKPKEKIKRK